MYKRSVLKNKLRLITVPNNGTKAATVLVLLPVGSRYETKNINGLSHFVEHTMFKGTKKRPTSLDITKELDGIGAEFNAFTSKDFTGYYIKSSAEKLELSFDILSDMLTGSVIDKTELEKERGVIVEEINMYEDNPLMYVESLFEELVFGNVPLGRQIAGPRSVIKSVSREKMLKYIHEHYHPANMVVVVSGKVDDAKVKKLTQKYFGKDGKKRFKKFVPFKDYQKKPQVIVKYRETEQVQMCLGFPGLSHFDKDLAPLQLLSLILGGNMSSRLFVNIREKHGLCYYIKAGIELYHDAGTLFVQAGLDKSRIEQAIELILLELSAIKQEGVTEKELQDAKDFLKGKVAISLEDSETMADWYGKQELFNKKLITPEDKLKNYINKVTQDDVQKVAKRIIQTKRLNLALIGPFKEKKKFEKLLKV